MNLHTIILTAGEGSRMNSNRAKSLQKIGGKSMLEMICKTAASLNTKITLVVGFDKESIERESNGFNLDISTIEQPKAIGTGDAVKCGLKNNYNESNTLILYGDVPLIKRETLQNLIEASEDGICILTTTIKNPHGYGRVKKDEQDNAVAIIEEKDANEDEKNIKEIFTGVLCSSTNILKQAITKITDDNKAGEFYLTDIVSIMNDSGIKIKTYETSHDEVKGANTKEELAELEAIYREMKAKDILDQGITVADPSRLDVRGEVVSGKDCSIDINVILEGNIELKDNVSIGPNCVIKNSKVGSNTKIEAFSHIEGAEIGDNCSIGPYARLREGSNIGESAKIGNFVETKNITLGIGAKANHLSYLGDSEIGNKTNIGAGTITCNYDGEDKHKTNIGNNSFIGSNSALVAPVTVGSNSTIAAGSVITKDVPDNALGVGRAKQTNKENWSKDKD